jgi:hypothetical protein
MTKTGIPVSTYRLGNRRLWPVMELDLTEVEMFGILKLGHWKLFEIWFLVLGIFIDRLIG